MFIIIDRNYKTSDELPIGSFGITSELSDMLIEHDKIMKEESQNWLESVQEKYREQVNREIIDGIIFSHSGNDGNGLLDRQFKEKSNQFINNRLDNVLLHTKIL